MTSDPLEPLAQSYLNSIGREEAPAGATCAEAYSLSTAISLKRIADALDGQSSNGSVLYWLEMLANAGRA